MWSRDGHTQNTHRQTHTHSSTHFRMYGFAAQGTSTTRQHREHTYKRSLKVINSQALVADVCITLAEYIRLANALVNGILEYRTKNGETPPGRLNIGGIYT